jgi:hypothetical protein
MKKLLTHLVLYGNYWFLGFVLALNAYFCATDVQYRFKVFFMLAIFWLIIKWIVIAAVGLFCLFLVGKVIYLIIKA